jgi:hypothetical protein
MIEVEKDDGTYASLIADQVTPDSGPASCVYSMLVWLSTSSSDDITVRIAIEDQAGTVGYRDVDVVADGTLQYFVLSLTMPGTSSTVGCSVSVLDDGIVNVDAVQLIDITNVGERFLLGSAGQRTVGFLDGNGDASLIPFIIDQIGPWMPDTVWVYNYTEDCWSCWRLPMTGFGYDSTSNIVTIGELIGTIGEQTWRFDEKRSDVFAPTNLIAQQDGQIYEISRAYLFDNEGLLNRQFPLFWESKDFDLDRPALDKTFSRLTIFHDVSHPAAQVTVGVSTDSGITWEEQTITIRQGFTTTMVDFFVTGNQLRFRVRNAAPGFEFSGFAVKIVPRGEVNAY